MSVPDYTAPIGVVSIRLSVGGGCRCYCCPRRRQAGRGSGVHAILITYCGRRQCTARPTARTPARLAHDEIQEAGDVYGGAVFQLLQCLLARRPRPPLYHPLLVLLQQCVRELSNYHRRCRHARLRYTTLNANEGSYIFKFLIQTSNFGGVFLALSYNG